MITEQDILNCGWELEEYDLENGQGFYKFQFKNYDLEWDFYSGNIEITRYNNSEYRIYGDTIFEGYCSRIDDLELIMRLCRMKN